VAFRSSGGRAFQIAGPATVNVPSAFLTIRYDTKKSLTWTQKLSDQLNLAHVAKKYEREETKTNKRQCPLSSVQV